MLEFENHDPARQDTPEYLGFGIIFGNLIHLKTSSNSLYVLHVAWPFQKPFLAWRCLPENFLLEMPIAVI